MSSRHFGTKDKITEALEVLTLGWPRDTGLGHNAVTLDTTVEDILDIDIVGLQVLSADGSAARGDIIIGNSATTTGWTRLAHPGTAGVALTTDGADVLWDQTPIWTGDHTWDYRGSGTSSSPALIFITQSDDQVKIFADNDPGTGESDLKIMLPGTASNSARVVIEQSDGTNVASFHTMGHLSLEMDDFEIGRGEHETGVNDVKLVFDTTPTPSQIKVEDGDLNFNTASHGIIHVDGNASGNILLANGTRYVPAVGAQNLPVAPPGQGYILRSNATPAWEAHQANTDGAALVGDGTDIGSTLTPTWKGVHTHTANVVLDDGSGDSPALNFIGGTNNDTASIYLDDDAGAGQSDFRIKLPGNDANCQLEIHDSGDVAVLQIDANGSIYMSDDQFIGFTGGGRLVFDATPTPDQIELTDGDLALFSGADVIGYSDAGVTETLRLDSSAGYIGVADRVYHIGDTNNYVGFSTDQMTLHVGGVDMLDLVEAATDEATFKCNVTLNTGISDALWLRCSGDVANTEADIRAHNQLGLAADQDVHIFIDASNISSNRFFSVRKNAENVSGSTELFRIEENGDVTIQNLSTGIVASDASGVLSSSAPGTCTVSSSNNSAGSHTHAITSDWNPGAASSLLSTTAAGLLRLENLAINNSIYSVTAKAADVGLSTNEFDNLYYVTANQGTSRLINSTKVCPVCSQQMKKGTGSTNILGELCDYEMVFCLSCGAVAVEERNKHTQAMLDQRQPPTAVILSGIRTSMMGGHDYKVSVYFDYGNGVANSTRLGDDELNALGGMAGPERKAFLLQLGEREWYAREEGRIMTDHASDKHAEHLALVIDLLNTDLMQ